METMGDDADTVTVLGPEDDAVTGAVLGLGDNVWREEGGTGTRFLWWRIALSISRVLWPGPLWRGLGGWVVVAGYPGL